MIIEAMMNCLPLHISYPEHLAIISSDSWCSAVELDFYGRHSEVGTHGVVGETHHDV